MRLLVPKTRPRAARQSVVEPTTTERLAQIDQLSNAVKTEFELVTARVGWFAGSQAFIVAAFAQVVASGGWSPVTAPAVLKLLAYGLPLVGIAASLVVHIAVGAAHEAAVEFKNQRDASIARLPATLQYRLIPHWHSLHLRGNLPARTLPTLVAVFWVAALASLSSVSK